MHAKPSVIGVLEGAVAVDDQMQIEVLGYLIFDSSQETEELLIPILGFALGEHITGGHIKGCKQGGGAVADVVVGDNLDMAYEVQRLKSSPRGWSRSIRCRLSLSD